MRVSAIHPVIAGIALLLAGSAAAGPANSCSDPYWKDTLRCAFFPMQVPQPEAGDPPPSDDPVPAFTGVYLTDDIGVRCVDGTAPLMYVDKAICTTPDGCGQGARYGEPVDSNRWMFTMPGGGSCYAEFCADTYADPAERGEMSSANKPAMKNLNGIHDPDPAKNPVFAGYNRVRVEKCSYDRYQGRTAHEAEGGFYHGTHPGGGPLDYNLYHHGYLMMEAAFEALESGLHYTTTRRNEPLGQPPARRRACCGSAGERIIRAHEKLPALADAEVVLFVGHSGGSHGLFHNIDNLAASLARIPGFSADVRALFDANFLPSVENEAGFATSAPPGSDAYSRITSGVSSNSAGPFSYDGEDHHETDVIRLQYDAWGAGLDSSCIDVHGAAETWRCRDRHHVLMNHVTTPFFIREDFTDPNPEHLNRPVGHPVRWAEERNYAHCPTEEQCDPVFNPVEYRARLEAQMVAMLRFASTRSELASGVDRSFAAQGSFPTFFAWMPECGKHDGAYDNDSFYEATISTPSSSFTMRQWAEQFMSAPRAGATASLIDGARDASGTPMRTTRCR